MQASHLIHVYLLCLLTLYAFGIYDIPTSSLCILSPYPEELLHFSHLKDQAI